jgi:anaerobic selenocysteine-containing dehydrogenase
MLPAMARATHPSICRFCHANCGILVDVEDGRPVRVTGDRANPAYHGFTCAKGRQLPALHAHPDRLLHSLKRAASGGFEPIASERATSEVAARIQSLIAEHGPRSVAIYAGTYSGPYAASIPFAISWLLATGSRMVFTSATIDQPGKNIANALHGRWLAGSHVFDESDAWLLLGNNPLISMSGGIPPANPARRLREAKARGLQLVVIDPRYTEVARSADVYLQPRPGEDPALLAALLHVVIRDGLVDHDFVRDHAAGFAELEAAVAPFTPRFAAERAGVAAEEIERAARAFGGARRGCGVAGTGPNMGPHGTLTEYLLLCLNTVCGRWRRAGEPVANPGALLPKAVPVAQAQGPRRAFGFGEKMRVRGLANSAAGLPTAALADEILTPGEGQVRALICIGSNPIAAWPDQHKTRRAMEALDLLVALDMKLSATSRLAHYVIAPKLSLEVPGISLSLEALEQTYVAMGYSEPYAQYSPALVAPPAGSDVIEDWEFFYGLAQRMGLSLKLYPMRAETGVLRERGEVSDVDMVRKPTTDEVLAQLVASSRVPLEEVKRHPHGAIFADPEVLVAPGDPACSDRLDVGNAEMLRELAEIAREGARAVEVKGRPFRLVSRRMPNAYNSSGRDIAALTHGRPYNPAFLHPDDLAALGVAEGDTVRIASDHASILGVATAAPELRRGVLSMSHAFGDTPDRDKEYREIGSTTGRLVDTERDYDRYSGIPRMSAIPVSIERAEGV